MSTENIKNKSFKTDQLSKCPFTGAGTPAKFSAGRGQSVSCLLYTSPSPRDLSTSRMPSSA